MVHGKGLQDNREKQAFYNFHRGVVSYFVFPRPNGPQ